jgi:2-hydroxy-6-oxonona-2,4-dienedioate hydrolase
MAAGGKAGATMSSFRDATLLGSGILIAALLTGGLLIQERYRTDLARANARVHSVSLLAKTACGPIEYAIAGQGPPILLIHGAGGGFDQGLQFGEPLVEAGFSVIAPSRFGYLRTPAPEDISPGAQADAHACLLDALGLSRVAVFGGSAGAPSALELCLRQPERCSALILVVPALFTKTAQSPPQPPSGLMRFVIETTLSSDFVFWLASRLTRDTMIESVLATPIEDVRAASILEQQRVLAALQAIEPIHERSQGLWIDGTVTTAPSRFAFERVRTPTLIVTTRNDRYGTLAGSREAAERIPGARLVIFPDGGHLWVGHQQELTGLIADFLGKAPALSLAELHFR